MNTNQMQGRWQCGRGIPGWCVLAYSVTLSFLDRYNSGSKTLGTIRGTAQRATGEGTGTDRTSQKQLEPQLAEWGRGY